MRIHCIGVGSIGSLLATSFAALPSPPTIRLIVRKKNLLNSLVASAPRESSSNPLVSLTIERDGILSKFDQKFEIENTPTPLDKSNLNQFSPSSSSSNSRARATSNSIIRSDPISTLIVTTKAPNTLPALKHLLPRLSPASTIVLCQNGMGVLESLLDQYFPDSDKRPSFVCATTTHGVWRKSQDHFVHAGRGELNFGVIPNALVLDRIRGNDFGQATKPSLEDLPIELRGASSLYDTIDLLLRTKDSLHTNWLSLPRFQIHQLTKLSINCSINALTALLGVHNGSLIGSQQARSIIERITQECSTVFAKHLDLPCELDKNHPLSSAALLDQSLKTIFNTSQNISSTLSDLLNVAPLRPGEKYLPGSTRTEMDFINGYVSRLGKQYRIPTPLIDSLGDLVKLKEEMLINGAVDKLVAQRSKGGGAKVKKDERKPRFEKVLDRRKKMMDRDRERERERNEDRTRIRSHL